jgi:hypothetical protein
MMMLSRVTLRKRRNEWGEYVVRAYDRDGRRYPDGDYFTDDWEDAVNTAETMKGSSKVTESTDRGRG